MSISARFYFFPGIPGRVFFKFDMGKVAQKYYWWMVGFEPTTLKPTVCRRNIGHRTFIGFFFSIFLQVSFGQAFGRYVWLTFSAFRVVFMLTLAIHSMQNFLQILDFWLIPPAPVLLLLHANVSLYSRSQRYTIAARCAPLITRCVLVQQPIARAGQ